MLKKFSTCILNQITDYQEFLCDNGFKNNPQVPYEWVLRDRYYTPYTISLRIILSGYEGKDPYAIEFYSKELNRDYPLVIDSPGTFKEFVKAIVVLNSVYGIPNY